MTPVRNVRAGVLGAQSTFLFGYWGQWCAGVPVTTAHQLSSVETIEWQRRNPRSNECVIMFAASAIGWLPNRTMGAEAQSGPVDAISVDMKWLWPERSC